MAYYKRSCQEYGLLSILAIIIVKGIPSDTVSGKDFRSELDLLSHEHQQIKATLQTLVGSKPSTTNEELTRDVLKTLKYLKEKLAVPESKAMLEGSGATYVRWGRTVCPDVNGTQKVYHGFAAGDHYRHGGPSELLCLPSDPTWEQYNDAYLGHAFVYGVEYEVGAMSQELFGKQLQDQNVPCVVCQSVGRVAALKIPGRVDCYSGWTKEYSGFLMGGHHTHKKSSDYTCVDSDPEEIHGKVGDQDGHLLYFVEAYCDGFSLPCPPYIHGREISCIICTK